MFNIKGGLVLRPLYTFSFVGFLSISWWSVLDCLIYLKTTEYFKSYTKNTLMVGNIAVNLNNETISIVGTHEMTNTGQSTVSCLPWASYQIRKIAGCVCAGNAGNVFPLVGDPGMYHDMCVTHVPWCLSGSLTRGGGENVPGIPGGCATRKFTYLARGPWTCPEVISWISIACLVFRLLFISTGTGYVYVNVLPVNRRSETNATPFATVME